MTHSQNARSDKGMSVCFVLVNMFGCEFAKTIDIILYK